MKMSSDLVLAALDEGDSAIAVLRPDAVGPPCIVEANKTHIRLLGYPRNEMIGMSLWALHGSATCVNTQKAMDDAVHAGKTLRGEIELLSRDKRSIWFGFTMMPVVDPATHRLHCVMLGRDITAKRREEREQAMLQGLLASAFQKVAVAALIVSSDGRILLSNGAAQTLTGYRAAELQGTAIHELTVPAHRQRVPTEANYELDLTLVCKDGRLTAPASDVDNGQEDGPAMLPLDHDASDRNRDTGRSDSHAYPVWGRLNPIPRFGCSQDGLWC